MFDEEEVAEVGVLPQDRYGLVLHNDGNTVPMHYLEQPFRLKGPLQSFHYAQVHPEVGRLCHGQYLLQRLVRHWSVA